MNRIRILSRRGWILALTIFCSPASAASAADNNVTVRKILTGLKNPRGVAVRPDGSGDTYEIFVAESGAGRIVKVANGKPEKALDVVSGFSTKSASGEVFLAPGVQSLHFLDHSRLLATGSDDDGKPFVRLYELPEPMTPIAADQAKADVDLPESDTDLQNEVRTFRGITRSQPNDRVGDFLIIAASGENESAGLVFVPVRAGTLGDGVPVQLKGENHDFKGHAIAVGSSGHIVVAGGLAGDSQQASKLEFINPITRRVVMQAPIELGRIVALAYSPKSGNLYAANYSNVGDDHAGVYRIDSTSESGALVCAPMKVANIGRPTALAFGPDDSLYVTSSDDPKSKNTGTLFKLTGDL